MAPIVDASNPLYCPEVSAHQFISSVRLLQASLDDAGYTPTGGGTTRFSYLRQLCSTFRDGNAPLVDSPKGLLVERLPRPLVRAPGFHQQNVSDVSGKRKRKLERKKRRAPKISSVSHYMAAGKPSESGSEALSSSSSDNTTTSSSSSGSPGTLALPTRPFKKKKRSSSHDEPSFVLSAKAARLSFSNLNWLGGDAEGWFTSDPLDDRDEGAGGGGGGTDGFWPDNIDDLRDDEIPDPDERKPGFSASTLRQTRAICIANDAVTKEHALVFESESPKSLSSTVDRLEALLPGVRLRTHQKPVESYQDLVNILGSKGHLTPQILAAFRHANVYSVNLSESMADVEGLNLLRCETLQVFKLSDSFQSLKRLVLSDVHLSDDDVMNLNNLSLLDTLFLDNTHIGDVGVMHLVALRRTLSHLELSWNDWITDDVVPALLALSQLSFLSLKGTSVSLNGLRKLASRTKVSGRKISLVLPSEAEEYYCNLEKSYVLDIGSVFVRDACECGELSMMELKSNLLAHSSVSEYVNTEGPREELVRRLGELLERKQSDLIVRSFMLPRLK